MRRFVFLFAVIASCMGTVLDATPGVPPVSNPICVETADTCSPSGVPLVCSPSLRNWNAIQRNPDGTERACPGGRCAVNSDGGAYCFDAAVDVAEMGNQ